MNLTELAMSYKFVKQTSGGGSGGSANNGGGVKAATFATLDEVTQFLITNNKAITHKLMYNGIIWITGDGVPEETCSNSFSATIDTNVTPDFAAVSYNFYTAVDQLSLTYASDAGELYLASGIYNLLGTVYMEVTPDFSEVSEWTLYYFDESTSSGGGNSGGLKKATFTGAEYDAFMTFIRANKDKIFKMDFLMGGGAVIISFSNFALANEASLLNGTSMLLTAGSNSLPVFFALSIPFAGDSDIVIENSAISKDEDGRMIWNGGNVTIMTQDVFAATVTEISLMYFE